MASCLKILVVDDGPVNLMLACQMLESQGFDVEGVSCGQQALKRHEQQYFDLVFMDIFMPGLDGMQTSRLWREQEQVLGQSELGQSALRRGERREESASVLIALTANADQAGRAVAAAEQALGGLDLLINNAGMLEPAEAPFADTDVEDMWRVVEVNVRGPMLVTHAVLPGMLERGIGRIVNINSGAGYRPMPVYTGYAISKGALARLTTLLDAQYRDRGIRAFDLAPGVIRTDMTGRMPMHEGRTEWTDPKDVVALAAAIADGSLDDLAGIRGPLENGAVFEDGCVRVRGVQDGVLKRFAVREIRLVDGTLRAVPSTEVRMVGRQIADGGFALAFDIARDPRRASADVGESDVVIHF
jgi:NAD(P)-dependent dehydrogenase (short-subunit alcohol dehydrogenase family)